MTYVVKSERGEMFWRNMQETADSHIKSLHLGWLIVGELKLRVFDICLGAAITVLCLHRLRCSQSWDSSSPGSCWRSTSILASYPRLHRFANDGASRPFHGVLPYSNNKKRRFLAREVRACQLRHINVFAGDHLKISVMHAVNGSRQTRIQAHQSMAPKQW